MVAATTVFVHCQFVVSSLEWRLWHGAISPSGMPNMLKRERFCSSVRRLCLLATRARCVRAERGL